MATNCFAPDLLEGKVVLVTGGSGETGGGIAHHFGLAGADVALTWHDNRTAAEAVARELRENHGRRAVAFPHDLYDPESNRTLPREVVLKFGRLDFVINNAGGGGFHDLHEITRGQWEAAFQGNVNGPFFLAREAARLMEEGEGGCVINIAATSALKASHAAYGISKSTVIEMTRFLAHTFAPRVRVICLVPGLLEIEDVKEQARRERAEASPLKRNCGPDDLGPICVACCSPAFRAVTGVSLLVDGGFWLNHP